eukprot:TRINITY_DN45103_c0_g1_i1.p1 TRINITY_DN45103_c0_g1~~TRINITY_DN45103_c0_g1_i1.p1  ORF type:complete len:1512 (+),score=373.65 TRINITY_DN45103_c0_g1_i1:296-4831(+)
MRLQLAIIWISLMGHVQTAMAILASEGAKSLHSALIRLLQNWMLSMSVLKQFDFSKVEMFSWGQEQMQAEAAAGTTLNVTEEEESDYAAQLESMHVEFPPWFYSWSQKIFTFDLQFHIGTPTETMNCMAGRYFGDEDAQDWEHVFHAMYYVFYPLLLIFWTIVIDVILVYGIWPPLKKTGFLPPTDPEEKKQWMLMNSKKALLKGLKKDGQPEERLEELSDSLVAVILELTKYSAVSPASFAVLSEFPKEALVGLGHIMEKYQRSDHHAKKVLGKTREAILKLARQSFEKEFEGRNDESTRRMQMIFEQQEQWAVMLFCLQSIPFEVFVEALQTPATFYDTIIRSCRPRQEGLLQTVLYHQRFDQITEMVGLTKGVAHQVWRLTLEAMAGLSEVQRDKLFATPSAATYDKIMETIGTGVGDVMLLARERPSVLAEIKRRLQTGDTKVEDDLLDSIADRAFVRLLDATSMLGIDEHSEDLGLVSVPSQPDLKPNDITASRASFSAFLRQSVKKRRSRLAGGALMLRAALQNSPAAAIETVLKHSNTIKDGAMLQLYLAYFQIERQVKVMTELHNDDEEADRKAVDEVFANLEFGVLSGTVAPFEVKRAVATGSWGSLIATTGERPVEPGGNLGALGAAAFLGGMGGGMMADVGFGVADVMIMAAGDEDMDDEDFGAEILTGAAMGAGAVGIVAATAGTSKAMTLDLGETKHRIPRSIFMLYREWPSPKQFFQDMRPLVLLLLYSTWYETTKQLLYLIHCVAFSQEENGTFGQKTRWMKHTDYVCYTGDHFWISALGILGLGIWSVGFVLALAYAIHESKPRITEPGTQRLFSFFIMGYEIRYCNWDVIVKRMDILCTILITFTNVAADVKAKLLCYAALAGVMLVLHADCKPFEDRKNRVLDRVEFAGLIVRFATFLAVELILVFNPSIVFSMIVCALIAIACLWYMINLWVNIVVELAYDIGAKHMPPSAVQSEVNSALDEVLNQCKKDVVFKLKRTVAKLTQTAEGLSLLVAHLAVKGIDKMTDTTLVVAPNRTGHPLSLQVVSRRDREQATGSLRLSQRILNFVWHQQLQFFQQTDGRQRDFLATVLGSFWEHMLCQLQTENIIVGSGQVAQFVLIARALKCVIAEKVVAQNAPAKLKAKALKQKLAWAVRAHEEEEEVETAGALDMSGMASTSSAAQLAAKLRKEAQIRNLSAEDLNDALQLLQSIQNDHNEELFQAAYEAIEERRLEVKIESALDASCQTEGRRLRVTVEGGKNLEKIRAEGNMLWCFCAVKPADKPDGVSPTDYAANDTMCFETHRIQGTTEPNWRDTDILEPVLFGDSLEFQIYDQRLLDSENILLGKASLTQDDFESQAFRKELPLEGSDDAKLIVSVQVLGEVHAQAEGIVAEASPRRGRSGDLEVMPKALKVSDLAQAITDEHFINDTGPPARPASREPLTTEETRVVQTDAAGVDAGEDVCWRACCGLPDDRDRQAVLLRELGADSAPQRPRVQHPPSPGYYDRGVAEFQI